MANEKRLIDANALWDDVDKSKHDNPHTIARVKLNHRQEHDHFLNMIFNAPTVDAVEVVRCKDCVHWLERDAYGMGKYHQCYITGHIPSKDHFCSYGERRTDNE